MVRHVSNGPSQDMYNGLLHAWHVLIMPIIGLLVPCRGPHAPTQPCKVPHAWPWPGQALYGYMLDCRAWAFQNLHGSQILIDLLDINLMTPPDVVLLKRCNFPIIHFSWLPSNTWLEPPNLYFLVF